MAKKAEAIKRASKEAQEALEKLQADQEGKVRCLDCKTVDKVCSRDLLQVSALKELKSDKANLQKEIHNGEKKLQVGLCQG